MDAVLFFALYADRSEEGFRQQFSRYFGENLNDCQVKALARGLMQFPSLLEGNERKFLMYLDRVVHQILEPGIGEVKLKRDSLYELLPLFGTAEMTAFLNKAANPSWDISFAKKMVALFKAAHTGMFQKRVSQNFFLDILPALADKYPLTIRAVYTEIRISNRMLLDQRLELSEFRMVMEESYEQLLSTKHK